MFYAGVSVSTEYTLTSTQRRLGQHSFNSEQCILLGARDYNSLRPNFFLQYKTCSCASLLHVFVSTAAKRVRFLSRLYYINLLTSPLYTLSRSIFQLPVVKTMCDCSEINCSTVKFCGGVIVKRIKLVLFSI